MRIARRLIIIAGFLSCLGALPLYAASRDVPGNWVTFNRTLAGDRYSPLKEIDRSNVAQLAPVCAFTLPEVSSFQTGPLVVNETMYITTDEDSYAIDASKCTEKWRQHRHSEAAGLLRVNRGFGYSEGRLFRGTSDAHILAMDAASGRLIWDHVLDIKGPGVSIPMAPIAAHGVVYVGNAGGDLVGVTGHVYALDARDGHVIWKFDVVPETGPTRVTWANPTLPVSGGTFWTSFTLDEPRNVLYVPAGNPAPDFDTELRSGASLYTDSVIAIDAANGRILGYNQVVKRDSHDWDVDTAPTLATTRSGKRIVASANKDGLLSILDRSRLGGGVSPVDLTSVLPLLSQTPTTTRENVDVPLSRDHAIRFCPGVQGGSEWNGAAFSPQSNSLFVPTVDWCAHVQLKRKPEVPAVGVLWLGAENSPGDLFDAPEKARGWLTAFDADTGNVRWKYSAPHPMLSGVTPTAGGLVFAADLGGQLYAFDARDGSILWQSSTGQSMGGGIVTYRAGGRQLVGVASGMKSPIWPEAAERSQILVYGLH